MGAALVALAAASTAAAYDRPPSLEQVASRFAGDPAEVRCPSFPDYFDRTCKLPLWGLPMSP
jgi:hypothetical protein